MGPDGIRIIRIRLAQTGVVHEHEVDLAVAVVVVLGEVNLRIECLAALDDCIFRAKVLVVLVVVGSVMGLCIGECHGAEHVEDRLEHTVGVVVVEVACGSCAAVHAVPGLVEQVVNR